MLVSIIERFQEEAERETDRYGAWEGAIRRLREDGAAGRRPPAAGLRLLLEDVPEDQREEALQDLVAEHLRLSWGEEGGLLLERYAEELGMDGGFPAEVIEDEFLARFGFPHGDQPEPAEYKKRFPDRPDVLALLEARILDGGRYVKSHKRGSGAMGEVWELYDRARGELVAMKECSIGGGDVRRQFAEEAAVVAGLDHPGIVGLRERQRTDGGEPLYTMRLVNGSTFSDRIADYHHPPSSRSGKDHAEICRALLEALGKACEVVQSAHQGGVLHRDLKPANIVIEDNGEVAIIDWGMTVRIGTPNPGGKIVGTPAYMPPEQAAGDYEQRSDVFGLGAILYELLTGRPPHDWGGGPTAVGWQRVVREGRLTPPCRVASRIPRDLDAICRKALQRDPADRYESALEMGRDLRRHLAGEPVEARRKATLARMWRRIRGGG